MLLAYKYVATAVMLAEVNFCAGNLHLRTKLPITYRDLRAAGATPPEVMHFGGRLETDEFFFGFNKTARLRYVGKFRPFGRLTVAEQNEMPSMLLARSASILARYASDGLLIEVVSCNHVCNQSQSH